MKPIMFILARIFGKRESNVAGSHVISYHWRNCSWVWKYSKQKIYYCRQCERIIDKREYEARDGICQRCWGKVGDAE